MYRIMVVDDEQNILNSLQRILKQKDWEIELFASPMDALRRAQVANFDLFISDYRMPEMNGVELLSEIKELQPESMRLILSGFTDLSSLLGAINQAEIYRFICKPWDDYDLLTTIIQALQYRDVLVDNRRLADQVRLQQSELDNRKTALEKLSEEHPALVAVKWSSDGSIMIEDDLQQGHVI